MTELRISELAERTGVPSTTLRYYEQVGLLTAARTPSGYRVYDERAVQRLRFISAGKRMQLSLDAIRDLLHTWQDHPCRTVKARLRPVVASRLIEAEDAVAALSELANRLRAELGHLDTLPDRDHACDPSCAFLDLAPIPSAPTPDSCSCEPDGGDPVLACSLGGTDHAERIARWRGVLASASVARGPLGVTVTLPTGVVREVGQLIAVEQECCPFLGFDITFLGSAVELRITAPNEAALPFVDALLPQDAPIRKSR